jgi:trimeric autotransporter adhesin
LKWLGQGFLFAFALGAMAMSARTQEPAAPAAPTANQPQTPSYQINGTVRSGKTPLPGVTVTATNTLTGKKFSAASLPNGTFALSGLLRGRYVLRVEFMGFATQTQEVTLNPENPSGKANVELLLASRQPQQGTQIPALAAAGRGFQSLALDATLSALSGAASGGGFGGGQGNGASDLSSLPLGGAGVDAPTESFSIGGAQGRTQDFGSGSEEDIQDRIREFRERQGFGGGPGGGPGGGGGGGFGGGGPIAIRLPRGLNINQPHGVLYFSDGNSTFDAKPYSLSGLETPKASYNQARFGAFVGGPLNIPEIFNGGNKTFFFVGWNGTRGSTPYDSFSTVPTLAERSGDFSNVVYNDSKPVQIFDPQTGQLFQTNGKLNAIPATSINSAATSLLQFIPLPNLSGSNQNFHYVTSAQSNSDSVNLRLIHNFGAGGGPGLLGGFGGGGGGKRGTQNNLNFGLGYSRGSSDIIGPYPSLNGGNSTQGVNASAGYVYGKGRVTSNLRFNYNHNHVSTTNLYSDVTDVAGMAGIGGISANPFDFGLPGISFTTFGGLSDPIPRRELDQTYTISDTVTWNRGKHNWRFGGDYRRILQSFRSAKNAEGSFIFTGFATALNGNPQLNPDTGYDFADFLLGLPQQTSLQSNQNGNDSYNFRANSYDLFAQDDWRFRSGLTFNLGLRYEYNGPYTEANNRIANLDVAQGFTGAAPVQPGQAGKFTGTFPASLVQPDRGDFAPRIGIAWKPTKKTVVRTGYGINYNLAQYSAVIQNLAFQPPFAVTSTNASNLVNPLTLETGFPAVAPGEVTNNYAIDRNYRLGYVQLWNLNIQRELPWNLVLNVGYNGAKGTRLDLETAPNRNPNGTLSIPGVQSFLFETSGADSILHAGTISIRRRQSKGIGFGATYVYSKSIDDASSIGGGATVVAQNNLDLAAERGLSSFDQRHKFTGNWIYDLPFGENKKFAQKGFFSHALASWQWSGSFTIASGLYFTPRVLGGFNDVNTGLNGTLRADYLGGPISLSNPTTKEFFNTAVFVDPSNDPAIPGLHFGTAGRNIIEGPGQVTLNMSLNRTIQIKEFRALDLRITANNVFNTVQFTSISTVVNAQNFGEVTAAGNMRRVTFQARFRF